MLRKEVLLLHNKRDRVRQIDDRKAPSDAVIEIGRVPYARDESHPVLKLRLAAWQLDIIT